MVLAGLVAGVLSLFLAGYLDNKLHIVVATIIAATIACFIEGDGKDNE